MPGADDVDFQRGMAQAIWSSVTPSYRRGPIPAAANRAASDLAELVRSDNGRSLFKLLVDQLKWFDKKARGRRGGWKDYHGAGQRDRGEIEASFGWNLALNAIDGRAPPMVGWAPGIKAPSFKVWKEGDDLVWEGGDSVPKVAHANPEASNFYLFYFESSWRQKPKQYWGPFSTRDEARNAMDADIDKCDTKRSAYKIERMSDSEFVKFWGSPPIKNPKDPHDVPHTKTVAEVREILARLPRGPRCDDPKCPGWIVSDSDKYGLEIETCDDCMRTLPKAVRLTDDEVAQLPEAQRELAKTIEAMEREGAVEMEFEGNPSAVTVGVGDAVDLPGGRSGEVIGLPRIGQKWKFLVRLTDGGRAIVRGTELRNIRPAAFAFGAERVPVRRNRRRS